MLPRAGGYVLTRKKLNIVTLHRAVTAYKYIGVSSVRVGNKDYLGARYAPLDARFLGNFSLGVLKFGNSP